MTRATLALLLLCSAASALRAQFTPPTPEELSMTTQKEVPGAAAVYLFREETTDDQYHVFTIYVRLKVLTEKGKDYANVELPYATRSDGGGYTVEAIQGCTIHPDGTVIPFTGKPMQKVIEKSNDRFGQTKVMSKVFTLPAVEVGSIIEYRYQMRNGDNYFRSPDWYIQSDLFTRKAHYLWKPTSQTLTTSDDRGQLTNTIAWSPILPPGVSIKQTQLPASGGRDGQNILELNVENIPPIPHEEMMPPIRSFSYRVLFYYSPYRTREEYWKGEGKHWAKLWNKFIGPGPGVNAAVAQLTLLGDAPEAKLRKLYAAVMELENTDFTRRHSQNEEKAAGLGEVKTTDDVLARKRGTGDQLAALFVAMARAAGMKASLMAVTNRDRSIFFPSYMSLSQLDDDLAIVNVDGKDRFFDPGTRYAPFGFLAWKHTYASGLRQTDNGAEIAQSSGQPYTASRVQRVANLKMDDQGVVTGNVNMTYTGDPALFWREQALTGDATELNRELKTSIEHLLPGGMEVTIDSVGDPATYEKPFAVSASVKGAIGSSTGKRLLVPANLFEGNAHPLFPHATRELPIYFEYPRVVQDAIRINLPAGMTVESMPEHKKEMLKTSMLYEMLPEKTPTSVTIHRNYVLGEIGFPLAAYPELRTFYTTMESKDQEPIVITRSGTTTASKQ